MPSLRTNLGAGTSDGTRLEKRQMLFPEVLFSSTCGGRNWEKQARAHCRRDEAIIHSGCHMDLHPPPPFSVRESSWLVLLELWAAMDVKRLWTGDFSGRNFSQFWKLETWDGVQPGQVLVRGLFLACRQLWSYRGRERQTGGQRHRERQRAASLLSLLTRALIPLWGPHPHDLMTSCLQIPSGRGLGFQHMNFQGVAWSSPPTTSGLVIFPKVLPSPLPPPPPPLPPSTASCSEVNLWGIWACFSETYF